MTSSHRIYLEQGKKWVFACAVDWPGWCRRGQGEEAAIETLLAYAGRYRAAVAPDFAVEGVDVVGRLDGNATTDFGAPASIGPWDEEPLVGTRGEQQIAALEAAWRTFDEVVKGAPPQLRKGPRGGGRDRDQIAEHVRDAERAYARKLGARVPPRTPWPVQREAIVAALRIPEPGTNWPVRYGLRRTAWHVLDHAWEIEDRSR